MKFTAKEHNYLLSKIEPSMDFHEASLRTYEALQRIEDAQPVPTVEPTFFVITEAWKEWALNQDELKELIDDAILGGLAYTIETCPF